MASALKQQLWSTDDNLCTEDTMRADDLLTLAQARSALARSEKERAMRDELRDKVRDLEQRLEEYRATEQPAATAPEAALDEALAIDEAAVRQLFRRREEAHRRTRETANAARKKASKTEAECHDAYVQRDKVRRAATRRVDHAEAARDAAESRLNKVVTEHRDTQRQLEKLEHQVKAGHVVHSDSSLDPLWRDRSASLRNAATALLKDAGWHEEPLSVVTVAGLLCLHSDMAVADVLFGLDPRSADPMDLTDALEGARQQRLEEQARQLARRQATTPRPPPGGYAPLGAGSI